MKPLLPALLLGVGLSTATVTPSVAYPADCAILLCLAGGWPASAECTHARAVFIRRITPWPIEPPLQIWNCPMRVSFRAAQRPLERLYDIAARSSPVPLASETEANSALILVQDQADVDISDTAFDFVRSIRVFEITFHQRWTEKGDCKISSAVYIGSYGEQGDYHRQPGTSASVPTASDLAVPADCRNYWHRSIFVEWRDYEGSYGHEEVHY
ncbi:MAG: hypothetical protein U0934_09190 [Pseudotabrizicola sp.]|uniref:hypothetical protein n=1 Tax=Pseudotabrizicola sp. TaxID=2939647 RepID=UPI00273164B2|nr:hypothetical protein [Pseudotabrizicola sp.]MDP2079426.1 hypothetical protein [Pseudotabrizicola sp.]MDZ7574117.1 hypothetical protein [Pseudotabrizicola sp.]